MGLFDNFKPAAPQAAPAATAPNQGVSAPAAAAPNSVANNPTVPSASNIPQQSATNPDGSVNTSATASPLDNFKDLWKTDPNAAQPQTPFTFNSDPAKLLDAARTVDFTKSLTPELSKRIQAGGADGQMATMEAMNNVAQMTFAQSAHATSKIVEQALQQQQERFEAKLPEYIKQHSVADSLRTTNPLMTNPAMAPMVEALQHQFTVKYPQATAQDIKSYVNDYLNGAADMITAQRPVAPAKNQGRPQEDWGKFFEQSR